MTELNIVPECYVDTKIAEILGEAKRKYNHQSGSGNVSNEMQHNRLKEQIALGIIDEDQKKGPTSKYFASFNLICKENNLILKKHSSKKHHLILVCPEVEQWLLNDAKKVGINPADKQYGLPNELKDFTKISKLKDIDKNKGFYKFIKALVNAEAPSITRLKNWIMLFKLNQLDTISDK